jgi:BMFP domain-containing protein YqiC
MQTRNPFMDDLARMMTGAAGLAGAAGEEARTLMRSQADRLVADMDLARREEVEILRALTRGLLERIDGLERRISALEGGGSGDPSEA